MHCDVKIRQNLPVGRPVGPLRAHSLHDASAMNQLVQARRCRNEYFIRAHIYARTRILTHTLSTLSAIAVPPFNRSGRKSDRRIGRPSTVRCRHHVWRPISAIPVCSLCPGPELVRPARRIGSCWGGISADFTDRWHMSTGLRIYGWLLNFATHSPDDGTSAWSGHLVEPRRQRLASPSAIAWMTVNPTGKPVGCPGVAS